jgi:ankyrin repeat protein
MYWSRVGCPDAVRHLLQLGAEIEDIDKHGYTALAHATCGLENINVIKELLSAGADPNTQGTDGFTPLMHIMGNATAPSLEVLNTLIDHGADVNARNAYGHTALIAAQCRYLDIAQGLIAAGADPTVKGDLGRGLSFFAAHGGDKRTSIVQQFRKLERQPAGKHTTTFLAQQKKSTENKR